MHEEQSQVMSTIDGSYAWKLGRPVDDSRGVSSAERETLCGSHQQDELATRPRCRLLYSADRSRDLVSE